MLHKKSNVKTLVLAGTGFSLLVGASVCFGAEQGLGAMAENITKSFSSFAQLMIATAYLAGIALSIAAIFQFKKHRDNPTQIPVSKPIALLAIGLVLIFFPAIIKPAGTTLLGGAATNLQAGGVTGSGYTQLPGEAN